ncbi:MAG: HAMP domain-containing sensor histidine kinase [Cyanobacteria bacterium P01_A01_bin.45]
MFTRSRRRLAYLFAMPMGLILFAFTFIVYYRQAQNQLQSFDRRLYLTAEKISKAFGDPQTSNDLDIDSDINIWQRETEHNYICLYDSNRNLRAKLPELETYSCPLYLTKIKGFKTIIKNQDKLNSSSIRLRQLTVPIKKNNEYISYLQLTSSLEKIENSLSQTKLFLSLGIPMTLGIIGIVGWLLGGLAMQPTEIAYKQLQRFTADASHELRAPVAAILSNAQVGLLVPENNLKQPRQRLENIVEISKTMSSLISNLLLLARHEGRLNIQDLENIDLVKFLQDLAKEYQYVAQEQELKLVTVFPSHEVMIKADPELLKQAIRNLLDNACKYTVAGGNIKILLNTRRLNPSSFRQFPLKASRQASIEIKDNGIGIPKKDLPYIFERFYRVDAARTRSSGGFGLGLAISLQIIQAHGGQISVNSKVEQGTTFQICLPLKKSI